MKRERIAISYPAAMFMLIMLTGCGNDEPGKTAKLTNPTCEDLGKIRDNAEHAALLAKCPDYGPGGAKKSKKVEW